ncbi:hypothetical protein Pint_19248 [Pistacia integerrima]|uniref:Uncharacterized protein n=1 Tax=Pistacia integerrima TaxID=434235 RepID=A0ACC0Z1R7_9ROSI|nr:hypothetical protein Pint_19248 [Pistacia integerrima]
MAKKRLTVVSMNDK